MSRSRLTVGVIPAREGSKGIPCKPLAPLRGEPLIAHTIRAALSADTLDRLVVSTDSGTIAEVASAHGVEVIMRPAALGTDTATTAAVLRHACSCPGLADADPIVTLQPTSPLRTPGVIDACVRLFLETGADSVVTMGPAGCPPEWMYRLTAGGGAEPLLAKPDVSRRQDVCQAYQLNGAVYVTARRLVDSGLVFGGDMRVVVMKREESVDIDEPLDLILAELIMARRGG